MQDNLNLTRSGIAYDLNISPHKLKITYDNDVVKFVFSSDLYKNIFLKKLEENREKINESLSNRFGFTIKNDVLCDIKLYSTIEKRGFLLDFNGKNIECLNTIKLDGKTPIIES